MKSDLEEGVQTSGNSQLAPWRTRSRPHRRREAALFYLMISPWLIGFLGLTVIPMGLAVYYSLCDYDVIQAPFFLGLANFKELFHDPLFFTSLWNTVYYTGLSVPLCLFGGLLLAILLNQRVRGLNLFRTIFYLPSVLPVIATVYLWRWIFNPSGGLLNYLLSRVGLNTSHLLWIYGQSTAKPALILMSLWGVGGGMIIYLAALQGVPAQLYEAAQLDGAGPFTRFWRITVPMISPVIFFNLITNMIGSFQTFAPVYILTDGKGGPLNATLMYMMYLYNKAFVEFRMGYGAAMAWILFLIILALTLLNFIGGKRWVYYQGERGGL